MARYYITGTYTYSGEVEADNEDAAMHIFYNDLNSYYDGTEDEEIELIEEDEEEDAEPVQE